MKRSCHSASSTASSSQVQFFISSPHSGHRQGLSSFGVSIGFQSSRAAGGEKNPRPPCGNRGSGTRTGRGHPIGAAGMRLGAGCPLARLFVSACAALQDTPADPLGDLRHYGPSKDSKTVQSSGNPIIHSTKRGCGHCPAGPRAESSSDVLNKASSSVVPECPLSMYPCRRDAGFVVGVGNRSRRKSRLPLLPLGRPPFARFATGVANNENSLANVRRPEVRRGQHSPFRIVPARGQVAENSSKAPSKQRCHVFHEDESRSNKANDPGELGPQSALFAANPFSLACITDVLARKAAAHQIDVERRAASSPPLAAKKVANVAESGDVRPVLREDAPGIFVFLHLPDRAEAAGAFKPKLDATDAAEQGADREHANHPLPCTSSASHAARQPMMSSETTVATPRRR